MVGSGMVLWKPKGAVVRMQLEDFLRAELMKSGYQPVYTPHIGRLGLYRISGHFPYYKDSQFPPLYETRVGQLLNELREAVGSRAEEGATDASDQEMAIIHEGEPTWETPPRDQAAMMRPASTPMIAGGRSENSRVRSLSAVPRWFMSSRMIVVNS